MPSRFQKAVAPLLLCATVATLAFAQDQSASVALPDGRQYALSVFRFSIAHTRVAIRDVRMSTDLESARLAAHATLAVNAGFFSETNEAMGVAISDGRTLSAHSSALGGGVIAITHGVAHLLDGETVTPRALRAATFAVQCRPRLVVARHANIHTDDGRRADRTALCLRDGGRTLDVVIARTDDPLGAGGPTLYAFSRELVARGCDDALNLDGGPSTGAAWTDAAGLHALPPRAPVRQAIVFRRF